jgi:predicted site-specific integrase-resolvase
MVNGRLGRLAISHKDRLFRFGAELVVAICEAKQAEAVKVRVLSLLTLLVMMAGC